MRALCFSGSGCLAIYQFGVIQCLLKHGQPLLSTVSHVVGCSGGSLVAAVLVNAPSKLDEVIKMSMQCQNLTVVEKVLDEGDGIIVQDRLCPPTNTNTHAIIQTHLHRPKLVVSTASAKLPSEEVQFSNFRNTRELLDCLQVSCHIPRDFHPLDLLSPFKTSYKDGKWHAGRLLMDGGFAAAIPTVPNAENILISAMSGPEIHICPQDRGSGRWISKKVGGQRFYVNTENIRRFGMSILGAPPAMMEDYLQQGFADCKRYLTGENLFQA
mmetsp:Transcript_9836/g.19617  ORF Transcript_9836/g.19617 Transcript_9836/m.19617 type:complete len:269 (-) Transcript_9836:136-942(-)